VTDWATISSLATAGGTLVLAIATFGAVRSANRAARATERALLVGIRPVLMSSRLQDPPEKVGFQDGHWVKIDGGHAAAEVTDEAIYLAIALRNAGTGMAVLDRWDFYGERLIGEQTYRNPSAFHRLTRDLYLSSNDLGFWQGALRDPAEPLFAEAREAIEARRPMTVDLLYGDHEGGQRTISRFSIIPTHDGRWIAAVARHWNLDSANPRDHA
jgi:hypothetical protein